LIRVLRDENLWRELSERSARAWQQYFSWDVIAQRFLRELSAGEPQGRSE